MLELLQIIKNKKMTEKNPTIDYDDYINAKIRDDRVGAFTPLVRRRLVQAARTLQQDIPSIGEDLPYFEETDDLELLDVFIKDFRHGIDQACEEEKVGNDESLRDLTEFLAQQGVKSRGMDSLLDLDEDATPMQYIRRFSDKNDDGSYVVPDEAVYNLLEKVAHNLAQEQTEFDTNAEVYKDNFRKRFLKGVELGWIPTFAANKLDRLNSTVIAVDDGMDMGLAAANALNFYQEDHYEVVVAPGTKADPERALTHEFIHTLDGGKDNNVSSKALYKIFGDGYGGTTMNEAVVEHLADALYKMNDDIDVVAPYSPERREGSVYESERALLDKILNDGTEKIDIRLFIAAHFEDEDGPASAELRRQLKQSFAPLGLDVVADIHTFEKSEFSMYGHNVAADDYANKIFWRANRRKISA